jgi:hypothetical protein
MRLTDNTADSTADSPADSTGNGQIRHWKQEPLVWLLIAIPFSAVVMGVVMITLAIQSWSGLVVDDYYRKGKQINLVLARDQFAHELGLAAGLSLVAGPSLVADQSLDDSGRVEIRFDPEVSVIPGERIELRLVHATRPGLDQDLIFENHQLHLFEAELQLPGPGRWNIFLQTADWRLTGSLQYPQDRQARLTPNYTPPEAKAE